LNSHSGGYRLRAYSQIPPNLDPQSLVGAKVLLKGTAATAFNAPLLRTSSRYFFIPHFEDFYRQRTRSGESLRRALIP